MVGENSDEFHQMMSKRHVKAFVPLGCLAQKASNVPSSKLSRPVALNSIFEATNAL